ncbi:hypothetical protein CPAR01_09874 [Colletotrichum paranaense]|uniref:Uncharacterized protein n=1 Tax=Colletotrichum paranaense TaxID=1914294 RepID=A0ABQ9SCE5_9PEZI|nr:uncharacterized protein CPAR01_09874 [Colletotrichum paranaense]KAK1533166.1 hypothetical protein CPAR01_09874 [Colletotrichum paranaense]
MAEWRLRAPGAPQLESRQGRSWKASRAIWYKRVFGTGRQKPPPELGCALINTPHHSMTFPISEAKAAGIVSLTDNATLAQRNSEAQPRIVTHHHPFAKHPFAALLCFGSSIPLVARDDASRTQSECRSPGYPIVSAHSLFLTRSDLRSVGSHGARSLTLDLCPANPQPPLQVCPASW